MCACGCVCVCMSVAVERCLRTVFESVTWICISI